MRHSYEKAMEIATQLTTANLQSACIGSTDTAAANLGNFYLKLVETLQAEIAKMPD